MSMPAAPRVNYTMCTPSIKITPGCTVCLFECTGSYLTDRDLNDVKRALWDARVKWHSIGLELGIPHSDLAAIESRHRGAPDACFRDMLTKFLQHAPPQERTWTQLADVMASPMVGQGDIAEQLRMDYC